MLFRSGKTYKNINRSARVKKLEKKLRRGHHIVQVQPDRKNKIKTIFLFNGTEELKEDLLNIAREERIALKKELFA